MPTPTDDKPPRRKGANSAPERLTEPEHPWDRLPDEGDKAYAAFLVYRDLGAGKRSLDAVGGQIRQRPPSEGNRAAFRRLESWCSRYGWVARALAFDESRYEAQRLAEAEQIKLDVVEAHGRRRQIRADAWIDYQLLMQAVRLQLEAIQVGTYGPKNVRELALARDRLAALAKEAFFGLEQAELTLDVDGLPPDLAAEITAVLAKHALRRKPE